MPRNCRRIAPIHHLQRAVELGVIDRYETNISCAVTDADMIVVCSPLTAVRTIFTAIRENLSPDAVLTDVGSAKQIVIDTARDVFGTVPEFLVPGHPIAGTEHSGVDASFATLFQDHRVILTPHENTQTKALERVQRMWLATGAHVDMLSPAQHDKILAATSHVPHLIAYTLVDLLGQMQERDQVFKFAAGGFRDLTRIASSDPQMWRDICLTNPEKILHTLQEYTEQLEHLMALIRGQSADALFAKFARSKRVRDQYIGNAFPQTSNIPESGATGFASSTPLGTPDELVSVTQEHTR